MMLGLIALAAPPVDVQAGAFRSSLLQTAGVGMHWIRHTEAGRDLVEFFDDPSFEPSTHKAYPVSDGTFVVRVDYYQSSRHTVRLYAFDGLTPKLALSFSHRDPGSVLPKLDGEGRLVEFVFKDRWIGQRPTAFRGDPAIGKRWARESRFRPRARGAWTETSHRWIAVDR